MVHFVGSRQLTLTNKSTMPLVLKCHCAHPSLSPIIAIRASFLLRKPWLSDKGISSLLQPTPATVHMFQDVSKLQIFLGDISRTCGSVCCTSTFSKVLTRFLLGGEMRKEKKREAQLSLFFVSVFPPISIPKGRLRQKSKVERAGGAAFQRG